ncbi:hypothetical protein [Cyclobacterium plantarum]|uniref:DUF4760 domain-containing protein n=1 Tax=Cyclobacterium plantarum TaxID=2716263 RepID=A0ABX0HFD1_9BACT|nr:hypothetical protein [Cyclobacterium plantarum]NHE58745.1 hypothetical protein [Cyclobacterium plantarum]
MTVEQFHYLIDNITSLWDSGMITIQTILITVAGWIAYQQLVLQKKNKYYAPAKELVKLNHDLNEYIRKLISTSITRKMEGSEYQQKFGNLPPSFSRTINKICQICEKIDPEKDILSDFYILFEKEIEVLGNQKLSEANYFKIGSARSIESEFLDTLTYIEMLNEKAPYIDKKELFNEFNSYVTKLPRFVGDKNSQEMKNFLEADLEIRNEIHKYL